MIELTIKHIAPYIPYGLKVIYHDKEVGLLNGLSDINDYDTIKLAIDYKDLEHIWMFKPILRPMSDFEIDLSIRKDFDDLYYMTMYTDRDSYGSYEDCGEYFSKFQEIGLIPKMVLDFMYENHLDVFGLIEQNLAISIHDLEK